MAVWSQTRHRGRYDAALRQDTRRRDRSQQCPPFRLAQLLAGRRTRLSTLIRDRQQYLVAARAARNIRSKIFELSNDRGIEAGYLSAGTVVWTSAVGGKPQRVSAPVMLTSIVLTVRPGEDDFELQLTEQARMNPRWCVT